MTAQYVVSNAVGAPFSTSIADEVRKVSGVDEVVALREAYPKVDGSEAFLGAVDPAVVGEAVDMTMTSGSLQDLRNGTFAVDSGTAKDKGWHVGDTARFEWQSGTRALTISAIYETTASMPVSYLVTMDDLENGGVKPLDSLLYITESASASDAEVSAAIDDIIAPLPTVTLKDASAFADEQKKQINECLYFIYALARPGRSHRGARHHQHPRAVGDRADA